MKTSEFVGSKSTKLVVYLQLLCRVKVIEVLNFVTKQTSITELSSSVTEQLSVSDTKLLSVNFEPRLGLCYHSDNFDWKRLLIGAGVQFTA